MTVAKYLKIALLEHYPNSEDFCRLFNKYNFISVDKTGCVKFSYSYPKGIKGYWVEGRPIEIAKFTCPINPKDWRKHCFWLIDIFYK